MSVKTELFKVNNHIWLFFVASLIILWAWHKVVPKKYYWTTGKHRTNHLSLSITEALQRGKSLIQVNRVKVKPWLMTHFGVRLKTNCSWPPSAWSLQWSLSNGHWEVRGEQSSSNYSDIRLWRHWAGGVWIFCLLSVLNGFPMEICTLVVKRHLPEEHVPHSPWTKHLLNDLTHSKMQQHWEVEWRIWIFFLISWDHLEMRKLNVNYWNNQI